MAVLRGEDGGGVAGGVRVVWFGIFERIEESVELLAYRLCLPLRRLDTCAARGVLDAAAEHAAEVPRGPSSVGASVAIACEPV